MTAVKGKLVWRLVIIVSLVGAIYGSTCGHGFVWDDTYIIENNPLLEKLANIPKFFLTEDTIEESTGYYRPVTYVSFALDRAVWGGNPAGFHLTNLVLHMLAAVLYYAVVSVLFKKERLAFAAALIFALHPIAGETVNFLSGGRNTLLCACFALLSLLFFANKRWILAVICFTLAIFSKEFALLLPLVFLLYDYRMRGEQIHFRRYLLYLVPITGYLTLRSVAVQKANFLSAINLSDSVTAPYLVVRYALNMLDPLQLKVIYSMEVSTLTEMLSLIVVVAMAVFLFLCRKREELLFSAVWFLLFLIPVLNIIPLHTTSVMADRYAYFALMGFALFLASVICRFNPRMATFCLVAVCAVYGGLDVSRNGIWKNDIEFFTRVTRDAPDKFVGYKNLGMAYYKKGEITSALHYLELADAKPDITLRYLLGDAYIYWKENMPQKAEVLLSRATELAPPDPEAYMVLMLIHEQHGDMMQARLYRSKLNELGLSVDQVLIDRVVGLCTAGERSLSKRQYSDAEVYLWQALQINPGYVPALIDMGNLRGEQRDFAAAVQYFGKAIALDPMNAVARNNLTMVYGMQGRYPEKGNAKGR